VTASAISGAFSTVSGSVPTAGLSQAVLINPANVQLALSTPSTASPAPAAAPSSPSLAPTPIVVAPAEATIFPAMTSTLVQGAQLATGMALDRIGGRLAGYGDTPVIGSVAPPAGMQLAQLGSTNSNLAAVGEAAAVLPQLAAQYGGWFRGVGSFASVNGNSVAPGFDADSGGFMAGVDREVMPDVFAGIAGGYTHSDVNDHSSSTGSVDTGRVLLYGGGLVGPAWWSTTAGYAHDSIATSRPLAGIGTAQESHGGNELTLGGQWSLPIAVGGATVTPKAGLQFLYLAENGFSETGASGFGLSSTGRSTDSLQPFVGIAANQSFVTDGGVKITPEVRLSYAYEAADDDRVLNVGTVSGATFLIQGVRPSRSQLGAGIGVTVTAQSDLDFYANYDSLLRIGNTVDQTVSAGLRIRF
jgi:fibronectin-binding autotransporter adhesin